MKSKRVIVIGAGLGGLSAALHLVAKGFQVTLLEKNPTVGGKLNRIRAGGYTFDTGLFAGYYAGHSPRHLCGCRRPS